MAASNGHKEVVEFLLQRGANIEARTERGVTPLYIAVKDSQKEIVELLLQHGANIEAKEEDGFTPLHIAAKDGQKEIVELLLQCGANIEARSEGGVTPLYIAAKNGYKEVVEFLLQRGANIEVKTEGDDTLFHIAVRNGYVEIADALLNQSFPYGKSVISAAIEAKQPVLYFAAQNCNAGDYKEQLDFLLENGMVSDGLYFKRRSAVYYALQQYQPEDDTQVLETLFRYCQHFHRVVFNLLIKKGNPSLIEALIRGRRDIANKPISSWVSPLPQQENGVKYDNTTLLQYLIHTELALRAMEDDSPRRVVRGSRGLSSRTELPESQRSQASEESDDKLYSASSHLRADLQCAQVHEGIGDEDGRGNLAVALASPILGMDDQNLSRGSDTTAGGKNFDVLSPLVNYGAHILACDQQFLVQLIQNKKATEYAKYFLDQLDDDPSAVSQSSGGAAEKVYSNRQEFLDRELLNAVKDRDLELINRLLDFNADPNCLNDKGLSPTQIVAEGAAWLDTCYEVLLALVKKGGEYRDSSEGLSSDVEQDGAKTLFLRGVETIKRRIVRQSRYANFSIKDEDGWHRPDGSLLLFGLTVLSAAAIYVLFLYMTSRIKNYHLIDSCADEYSVGVYHYEPNNYTNHSQYGYSGLYSDINSYEDCAEDWLILRLLATLPLALVPAGLCMIVSTLMTSSLAGQLGKQVKELSYNALSSRDKETIEDLERKADKLEAAAALFSGSLTKAASNGSKRNGEAASLVSQGGMFSHGKDDSRSEEEVEFSTVAEDLRISDEEGSLSSSQGIFSQSSAENSTGKVDSRSEEEAEFSIVVEDLRISDEEGSLSSSQGIFSQSFTETEKDDSRSEEEFSIVVESPREFF